MCRRQSLGGASAMNTAIDDKIDGCCRGAYEPLAQPLDGK